MQQFLTNPYSGAKKNLSKQTGTNSHEMFWQYDSLRASSDASLFSSSMPILAHEKLNLTGLNHGLRFEDGPDIKGKELLESKNHAVGSLPPGDEDELLLGIVDGFDVPWLTNLIDDSEEDLFDSGGGLELESDLQETLRIDISKLSVSHSGTSNGGATVNLHNGLGTVAGEHPLGEHPSRTLFVRNINSSVDDAELRALFEQYGDIRTLYTACKHRGFVMISYYDIRSARSAMRSLQNKPLRRRKLDIHFSIPKENPTEKDLNQGTLVVFNLDPSVSNDELKQIFGAYGEVKEIRETPNRNNHKFIEFYDVRAAEGALKSLNRSDIAGKRIKLEPSRPGGARRSSLLHSTYELEQDDRNLHHQVSSPVSPAGTWPQFGSPVERNSWQNFNMSPGISSFSPPAGNSLHELASALQPRIPNSRVAPSGRDCMRVTNLEHVTSNGNSNIQGIFGQSNSFPEARLSQFAGHISSFDASSLNVSSTKSISGLQFLKGSSELHSVLANSSSPSTQPLSYTFSPNGNYLLPFPSHGSFPDHHYHVGSAPLGVPLEQQYVSCQESPTALFMHPSFEGVGHNDPSLAGNTGSLVSRNMAKNGSSVFNMPSPRNSPVFLGNGHFPGLSVSNSNGLADRARFRIGESHGVQIDYGKQFELDLDKIKSGFETRTTLMIKNIPNKYTSKLLMEAIDEHHKGTYDFLYLPIDFKNKCNMGYAFINMLSQSNILPFYEAFNGKKWEKFNSEKVASLAFARIQGKAALVAHFQNSSLMNEDKHFRPILFDSEGTLSNQEHQSNGSDNILCDKVAQS